jgi:glucokinase
MAGEIAIDIGGTKTLVSVTGDDGAPSVLRLPTRGREGADAIVEQIAAAVASVPTRGADGVAVVACPGSLDSRAGVVHYAANLPFRDYALAAALSERLGVPVSLVGDATAAAVAEFTAGAAAGVEHGAYVTVSTGIGMGLVVGGRLATGANGQGGELGHVPVRLTGGVRCACGQRGCLEAYASGRGLADRALELVAGGAQTPLAPSAITARSVIRAWRDGDAVIGSLVAQAIDLLGVALAAIVRVLAPQTLVLGGGLILAGGLFEPVRERVVRLLEPNAASVRERMRPAKHGELSALAGAAALARGDAAALRLIDSASRAEAA